MGVFIPIKLARITGWEGDGDERRPRRDVHDRNNQEPWDGRRHQRTDHDGSGSLIDTVSSVDTPYPISCRVYGTTASSTRAVR